MAQADRIFELSELFQGNRYAISVSELAARLECSIPSVKRYIGKLRNEHGVPIIYDPARGGYLLDRNNEESFELPGLWFNVSELHSLLTIHDLIDKLNPGLLKAELSPLRERIDRILASRGVKSRALTERFLFMGIGIRLCCPNTFRTVASATIQRQRLKLRYHSRGRDAISARTVSPQQLIYYRGNWYLAAHCHTRKKVLTLSLDRMQEVRPQTVPCHEIAPDKMQQWLTDTFGIFTGPEKKTAVLRFTKDAARWAGEETWHTRQQTQWLQDGSLEMCLPYSDERELVLEILRYGPGVMVESPPELRATVRERLAQTLDRYEKNEEKMTSGSKTDTGGW